MKNMTLTAMDLTAIPLLSPALLPASSYVIRTSNGVRIMSDIPAHGAPTPVATSDD